MKILITGSGGLVGSEAALYFGGKDHSIFGMDNNFRATFFGKTASVSSRIKELNEKVSYWHSDGDISDYMRVEEGIRDLRPDVIIHTAAQPSHDFAASHPWLDFNVNAVGTLNLLMAAKKYVPECTFIYTSTNKVYGDTPNSLAIVEWDSRYELHKEDKYYQGIDESMSIDNSTHSLFGVSKVSADLMVQEYGRYFGMNTVCFRCGCITGPAHRGAELHGFLAYLVKCIKHGMPYTIYGYKGKQVRDNIHANDLVMAFEKFIENPKQGAVYNIGGGRENSCSVLEVMDRCVGMFGKSFQYELSDQARVGDHQWWISSNKKFEKDYSWEQEYTLFNILEEIYDEV